MADPNSRINDTSVMASADAQNVADTLDPPTYSTDTSTVSTDLTRSQANTTTNITTPSDLESAPDKHGASAAVAAAPRTAAKRAGKRASKTSAKSAAKSAPANANRIAKLTAHGSQMLQSPAPSHYTASTAGDVEESDIELDVEGSGTGAPPAFSAVPGSVPPSAIASEPPSIASPTTDRVLGHGTDHVLGTVLVLGIPATDDTGLANYNAVIETYRHDVNSARQMAGLGDSVSRPDMFQGGRRENVGDADRLMDDDRRIAAHPRLDISSDNVAIGSLLVPDYAPAPSLLAIRDNDMTVDDMLEYRVNHDIDDSDSTIVTIVGDECADEQHHND